MAESSAGATGFSLNLQFQNKKSQRKVEVEDKKPGAAKDYVVGFTDGGLQSKDPVKAVQAGHKVIPKLENTYQTGAKKHNPNRFLPPSAEDTLDPTKLTDDKFEAAAALDTSDAPVQYGLNLRSRQENGNGSHPEPQRESQLGSYADRELQKFKEDLEKLPPEADLDAYEAMPIEAFGEALLRGMGWTEGKAIGRHGKEEVRAKELVRREARLGLGARPAPMEATHKKYIKPGESREAPVEMVYLDKHGHQKHLKGLDDVLVARPKTGVQTACGCAYCPAMKS